MTQFKIIKVPSRLYILLKIAKDCQELNLGPVDIQPGALDIMLNLLLNHFQDITLEFLHVFILWI